MTEFILGGAVTITALAYAAYKHYGLATLESKVKADIQAALAKADKSVAATISATGIVAGIKSDLSKYLGL